VVAVEFQSSDITVNENNGKATVCLVRNATTEEDMTVSIVTTLGSAGSEYFIIAMKCQTETTTINPIFLQNYLMKLSDNTLSIEHSY